jgi:redox-regulated HSP33 family molecular chaperone
MDLRTFFKEDIEMMIKNAVKSIVCPYCKKTIYLKKIKVIE